MVYNGKPYEQNGLFRGTIIFGNTHVLLKSCVELSKKNDMNPVSASVIQFQISWGSSLDAI